MAERYTRNLAWCLNSRLYSSGRIYIVCVNWEGLFFLGEGVKQCSLIEVSPSGKKTLVITISPVDSVWQLTSAKYLLVSDESRCSCCCCCKRRYLPLVWQSQAQQLLLCSLDESAIDEGLLAVAAAERAASRRSIRSSFSIRWSDRISSTSCIEAVRLRLE